MHGFEYTKAGMTNNVATPLDPAPPASAMVSVVVPLYNKKSTVLQTIQSVLRQTFSRFELIVIDDGSTDGGAVQLRQLTDPRIRVIWQENQGVSAARNRGITEATAALVAFLDADDWWEPTFLDAVVALSHLYPDAGILATGLQYYIGPECRIDTSVKLPPAITTGLIDYTVAIQESGIISVSNSAVPKHVFAAVGSFPVGEAIGEDRDFWARVTLRYPVACDNRILAVYNLADGGRTCQVCSQPPPYPPVIKTLTTLLESGTLRGKAIERATLMLDFHTLDYIYTLIEAGFRSELHAALRREHFRTLRFAVEALVLRWAAYLLPLRCIVLIKHRHRWLPTVLDRRKVVNGKALVHRRFVG